MFFFQAEDGIRDVAVTGVQTCALPIYSSHLSSGPGGFLPLLAQDGIKCVATNAYGGGLGNSQKTNFAPRVGFAYQVSPKLVARGGVVVFFTGLVKHGVLANIRADYPLPL